MHWVLPRGGDAVAEVQWMHNLDRGLQRAKEEDKLVLLDFFSPT